MTRWLLLSGSVLAIAGSACASSGTDAGETSGSAGGAGASGASGAGAASGASGAGGEAGAAGAGGGGPLTIAERVAGAVAQVRAYCPLPEIRVFAPPCKPVVVGSCILPCPAGGPLGRPDIGVVQLVQNGVVLAVAPAGATTGGLGTENCASDAFSIEAAGGAIKGFKQSLQRLTFAGPTKGTPSPVKTGETLTIQWNPTPGYVVASPGYYTESEGAFCIADGTAGEMKIPWEAIQTFSPPGGSGAAIPFKTRAADAVFLSREQGEVFVLFQGTGTMQGIPIAK